LILAYLYIVFQQSFLLLEFINLLIHLYKVVWF